MIIKYLPEGSSTFFKLIFLTRDFQFFKFYVKIKPSPTFSSFVALQLRQFFIIEIFAFRI